MADKKFLDEDGVSQFAEETKKYVDKHADNADIHVTAADKSNWNGKQAALTAKQLANIADVVNKANDSDVVHKTGAETAAGVKTFSDGIVSNLINGKTPELIEEQGEGYIRYSSGIQICWGTGYADISGATNSFSKPFINIVYKVSIANGYLTDISLGIKTVSSFVAYASPHASNFDYIVIGRWK